MALLRPFRAILHAHEPGADISHLVAPPYDVISPAQRERLLARDTNNTVALELPEGALDPDVPGNRYETGAARWREWLGSGALTRDTSPALYVLEQSWTYRGTVVRRRAFIGAVSLHAFDEGVVLPHERTLPKALGDRFNLIRATAANLSQVFGLYSDFADVTGPIFEAAMCEEPTLHATDDDGVASRLWAIRDSATIDAVAALVADSPIFIADGHHRYTTALAYRDERRAAETGSATEPAYDFVMMALVNMDDPDLIVLPTHRLARAEGEFDAARFWEALERTFDLTELPAGHPADVLAAAERTAFIVKTRDGATRLAMLRADVDPATAIELPKPASWKRLDVAILQELALWPLLGIHPDHPHTLERLSFAKDPHEALELGGADVAFLMNATRMEQLREVAITGEMMPQKSTYFYPKLLSGLLFRSLD